MPLHTGPLPLPCKQSAESCIVTSAVAVRHGEAPALHPIEPTPEDLDSAPSDALWVEVRVEVAAGVAAGSARWCSLCVAGMGWIGPR